MSFVIPAKLLHFSVIFFNFDQSSTVAVVLRYRMSWKCWTLSNNLPVEDVLCYWDYECYPLICFKNMLETLYFMELGLFIALWNSFEFIAYWLTFSLESYHMVYALIKWYLLILDYFCEVKEYTTYHIPHPPPSHQASMKMFSVSINLFLFW